MYIEIIQIEVTPAGNLFVRVDEDFLDRFLVALGSGGGASSSSGSPAVNQATQFDEGYDSICPLKAHKGKTWRKVLADDSSYVQWAIDNVDWIPIEFKDMLQDAVNNPSLANEEF